MKIEKKIPFTIETINSLLNKYLKFFLFNFLIASALIYMPSVCVAAIPPILATIGMSTAAYTTFSKTSANRLIEAAAIIAVKRLIESQKILFCFL